jgi:hypothetical protein
VKNEFKVNGKDLLNKIEEIIKEGNIRRIIIKNDEGKTFIEIPLTIGIIGVLAAPVMAAVGALAGIVANFTVEVIRKEDVKDDNSEVVDFTEIKTED